MCDSNYTRAAIVAVALIIAIIVPPRSRPNEKELGLLDHDSAKESKKATTELDYITAVKMEPVTSNLDHTKDLKTDTDDLDKPKLVPAQGEDRGNEMELDQDNSKDIKPNEVLVRPDGEDVKTETATGLGSYEHPDTAFKSHSENKKYIANPALFWPLAQIESGIWIIQIIIIILFGYESYRRKAKIFRLENLVARQAEELNLMKLQNKERLERERRIDDELLMYSKLEGISYNALHVKNDVPLGEGAHGKVFEGLWQNNTVAVKKYNINRQKLLSVLQEASLIAQLKHDHIIKSFGVVVPEIMVVFEKMDQSLHAFMCKATLGMLDVIQIALDVARALHYMHSNNPKVIHRDVKPENIMLSLKNNWLRAKLADFGVARFLYDSPAETITGTISYLAPEIKDEKTHTEKADIYSYGMTLLQVKKNYEEGVTATPIREKVSEILQNLIHDCKKNDPQARPTAKEIIDRLGALQRDIFPATDDRSG